MIILKFIIVILVFSLGVACFVNIGKWSIRMQQYFINQANAMFKFSFGWDRPLALLLCKIIVAFVGFVLLISAYPIAFGPVYIGQ